MWRDSRIGVEAQGALLASGISLLAIQAIATWTPYSFVTRILIGVSCLVPCVLPCAMARLAGERLSPNAAFVIPLAGAFVPVLAALNVGPPPTDGLGDEYGMSVLVPLLASWAMSMLTVVATGLALTWNLRRGSRATS